ncbi:glycoside hydrolase [Syncephalastrum racemosum]|uniref:alpha-1,2-Mannosidase n=1 Tax=Syncephalastrum racemosum TaxID=13706 RepID=A0A1X2HC13_SYNRA|nr:glycoside hydrolase [Syncephalastrum racemosum]
MRRDIPSDASMIMDDRNLKPYISTEKATENNEATMKGSMHHDFHAFRSQLPRIQYDFSEAPTTVEIGRREAIKAAFRHAWNDGYIPYALGHDELQPISKKSKDTFGGWGATLVDGLSTLLTMELHDEFQAILPELAKINFTVNEPISVFESTIRYLGGLLSAYEMTDARYPILLQKAEELGQVLLPAFDTPSGLPPTQWNPVQGMTPANRTLIAEVGTLQLELFTLSAHTGDIIYAEKAQAITDTLRNMGYEHGMHIPGLYPTGIDTNRGRFMDAMCRVGAMGDSVYEYFLKEYILTDGVPQFGRLYLQSVDSIKQHMIQQLPGTELLFLPPFDTKNKRASNVMDHLTCFAPGMFAIGSRLFDRPEDMDIAKGLLEMCVYMYRSSATGLCPETWTVADAEPYNPLTYGMSRSQLSQARDWWYGLATTAAPTRTSPQPPPLQPRVNGLQAADKRYLLRPETLESIYILYRMTGDKKYQEYGWEIFEALEKWCKTDVAYAALRNVEKAPTDHEDRERNQMDSMER